MSPRRQTLTLIGGLVFVACLAALASVALRSDESPVPESATAPLGADSLPELTTSTALPRPTTTVPTTTTTAAQPPLSLSRPVGSGTHSFQIAPGGWILPSQSGIGGFGDSLFEFVPPNDGEFGVTIDDQFLAAHEGAAWLTREDGRAVITGINAANRCLNITATVTLRSSHVSCPTRTQSEAWGYAGAVGDAPAVNILAANVVLELNTITCTGVDRKICGRAVRVSGENATVWFNDLSGGRGAVQLFTGTLFAYNYIHDLSFGFDPSRVDTPSDNVTHNNVTNNQGYRGTVVRGNYIEASYGRVSTRPEDFRNPHFGDAYADGVVDVGDPINGFVFANYLHNGDGEGTIIERNYVEGAGRAFRCNASSKHAEAICAESMRFNVFAQDRLALFAGEPRFEDKDGTGLLDASCNYIQFDGVVSEIDNSAPADECANRTDPALVAAVVASDLERLRVIASGSTRSDQQDAQP